MEFNFFRKKKDISKIGLSELKMLNSELEVKISALKNEIDLLSEKTDKALDSAKNAETDMDQKIAAREIANLVQNKKELYGKYVRAHDKKNAIERLIRLKEDEESILGRNIDLFDEIDVESLEAAKEEKELRQDIEHMRVEEILSKSESSEDYEKILQIVKSVNLDKESTETAKTDLDRLSSGQII